MLKKLKNYILCFILLYITSDDGTVHRVMGLAEKYQATWLTHPLEHYVTNKRDGGFESPLAEEVDIQACQRNINGIV